MAETKVTMKMVAPFWTYDDTAGNPWREFCIDGVHVRFWSAYFPQQGGSTGYEVMGPCGGGCRQGVHPCVDELIARFKETGDLGRTILHRSLSDHELECQKERDLAKA